jgi:hypothetical protein
VFGVWGVLLGTCLGIASLLTSIYYGERSDAGDATPRWPSPSALYDASTASAPPAWGSEQGATLTREIKVLTSTNIRSATTARRGTVVRQAAIGDVLDAECKGYGDSVVADVPTDIWYSLESGGWVSAAVLQSPELVGVPECSPK